MKPYFAKYLPVDGGIKQGDHTIKDGIIYFHHRVSHTEMFKGHQKVNLFLCSRDIQVGDAVKHDIREAKCETDEQKQFYISRNSYKVMGEISTEATWVKEGDEFDEDEWRYWNSIIGGGVFVDKAVVASIKTDTIKIKGPCGYFH